MTLPWKGRDLVKSGAHLAAALPPPLPSPPGPAPSVHPSELLPLQLGPKKIVLPPPTPERTSNGVELPPFAFCGSIPTLKGRCP